MISPMLAFRWNDKKKHMPFPCWVQPKLNGLRCLYQSGAMMSRSHGLTEPKFWSPLMLTHIREELSFLPDHLMLDGELYIHGKSLQQINSAAAVSRKEPNDKTSSVEYHIFDCFDENAPMLDFSYRRALLESYFDWPNESPIKLVPTYLAITEHSAETHFATFKKLGYEGMMLRNPESSYGQPHLCGNKENRWNYLLKRKDWLDEEVTCVGFSLTEGEKGERGFIMTCVRENGIEFDVGSGLSHGERDAYETNPPLGRTITVKYEMLSDSGKPLKPTILLVHD